MTASGLSFPLDVNSFLRRRRALRRELAERPGQTPVRIAVLGGTTTQEIVSSMEVLLLDRGIRPSFCESGYNRFFEDAVLGCEDLTRFAPEVIYVCTSAQNLRFRPGALASEAAVETALCDELAVFRSVWSALERQFPAATIIQNNFEPPAQRELGNLEGSAAWSAGQYAARLNLAFAAEARENPRLKIADVHGLAAQYGMERWFSRAHWHSYRMAQSPEASVRMANSVAALIAALYGRSKKCLILDLDNTLWGGVIGDDGLQGIRLGRETGIAEAHTAFQAYCKQLKERGVLLAVCSKNDDARAREGFDHPDSVLRASDFSAFRANWSPKHENVEAIAAELNLGLDSFVFVDDNPAERALVRAQLPAVAVPEVGEDVALYPAVLEEAAWFEPASLSAEDSARALLYAQNAARRENEGAYRDYGEYLRSLEMEAEIGEFAPVYMDRIAQLTGKTNQFNLTTRRYTRADLGALAARPDCIALYGRLKDRFGDNGLVSVVLGLVSDGAVEIDLWLMSCRVLKRDFEIAMLDRLAAAALARGAPRLIGRYVRTAKNGMVADHYEKLGFTRVSAAPDGSESVWQLAIEGYRPRNTYIRELTDGSEADTAAVAANLP